METHMTIAQLVERNVRLYGQDPAPFPLSPPRGISVGSHFVHTPNAALVEGRMEIDRIGSRVRADDGN
jgi:hypothetical protein